MCERIKQAAKIHNDVVTNCIKNLMEDDDEDQDDDNSMFVYHYTKKCYKSYTHSRKLTSIEKKIIEKSKVSETEDDAFTSVKFMTTLRRNVMLCAPL